MTVITATSGDFTAKISLESDFHEPDYLQAFKDLNDTYHFSATERSHEPALSRTIYFIMEPNITNGRHVYPSAIQKMVFIDYKDRTRIKAHIISGECTIDFDHQKQHYIMSFHVLLKNLFDDREIDILGSFNLTVVPLDFTCRTP